MVTAMGALALCFGLLLYYFLDTQHIFASEADYRPEFLKSKIELVRGEGFSQPHLYVQTDQKLEIGQKLDSIRMIRVDKLENFVVTSFESTIALLGDGYVAIKLEDQNFDCFAVYENNQLIRYDNKEFYLLPTPGDTWMCDGFDFKNAMKTQLLPINSKP